MKIGILGGGLAGLSLGYFLNSRNRDFLILEKNSETSGLLKSIQIDGFTFDAGGSHVIFSKNKEVLSFILSILKGNIVRNRRNAKILYKGRYVKYPFENGLAELPKRENFECLYYFIQNYTKKEKGLLPSPKNLKEWFYYMFGKGIAEKYLVPYNEKLWKFPLEGMDINWVSRIPQPPLKDIIKSSLGIPTEGYRHQLYFYYPKFGGIQALAKALEEPIKNKIITNFEVKKIKKEDGKWIVSNGKAELEFEKIISTIPLGELITILKDAPKEIKRTARELKFNSLITVGIGIDKPKVNNFSWVYIPDQEILSHRISFPSNYSPYVSPNKKSSILAEITYRDGDEIGKMKNEEIVERTIEDLHTLKVINKNDVVTTTAHRIKYAYVIYDLECSENLRKIITYISKIGIDVIGRFGKWEYLNMDQTVEASKKYIEMMG